MDTDHIFHELFRDHPEWLRELTGLPLPEGCRGSALTLNLLLQRFKTKTREEIRKMIAELTPLHETRAGRELLEEGIERGREEGIERGREAGQRADILEALEIRFGTVPEGLREAVEVASGQERLRGLHRAAILSATLEEFAQAL
ncbi:MAG TPA: hypothetical protein PLA50_03970 [Bacteroidia bacterium]|nr:hypothetical protein [Bacteroidia bacterium]